MIIHDPQTPVTEMIKEFFCSGEIWHEFGDKVSYGMDTIWHGLEAELKMADYSPVVKAYATFYICYPPEQTAFHQPEEGWYARNKKTVYQSFNLDYLQVETISQEELLEIMMQKYLAGIPKIKTFWGMKKVPFDTEKFYHDAQQVFLSKGIFAENQV